MVQNLLARENVGGALGGCPLASISGLNGACARAAVAAVDVVVITDLPLLQDAVAARRDRNVL